MSPSAPSGASRPGLVLLAADEPLATRLSTVLGSDRLAETLVQLPLAEATPDRVTLLRPGAVILAGSLPSDALLRTAQRLRRALRRPAVVLLTPDGICPDELEALRAGVAACLPHDAPPLELIRALRWVAQGHCRLAGLYLSRSEARRRAIAQLGEAGLTHAEARLRLRPLTERQLDLLQALARGQTNDEVAASLGLSPHTIKNALHALFRKLGVSDRTQAALYALRQGWAELSPAASPGGPPVVARPRPPWYAGLGEIATGGHVAVLDQEEANRLRVVTAFVEDGLSRGERCLYAHGELPEDRLVQALSQAGLPVGTHRDRAVLVLSGTALPTVLDLLPELAGRARAAGHSGLRVALEMDGLAEEELLPAEARLGQMDGISILCLHSRGASPGRPLAALRSHPWVLLGERWCANPFAEPARALVGAADEGDRVAWMLRRLEGLAQEEERRRAELAQEHRLRSDAEEARQQLAFLADASVQLAGTLGVEATLERVARLAVPEVADWCLVDLLEPDRSVRRVVTAHADPAKEALARQLQRRYPTDPTRPRPILQVIRSGKPELYGEVPRELLTPIARDEEHLRILREEIALGSVMIVPLQAEGRTLGAIVLATERSSGRRYGLPELILAEELARRAGQAVINARRYDELETRIPTL